MKSFQCVFGLSCTLLFDACQGSAIQGYALSAIMSFVGFLYAMPRVRLHVLPVDQLLFKSSPVDNKWASGILPHKLYKLYLSYWRKLSQLHPFRVIISLECS